MILPWRVSINETFVFSMCLSLTKTARVYSQSVTEEKSNWTNIRANIEMNTCWELYNNSTKLQVLAKNNWLTKPDKCQISNEIDKFTWYECLKYLIVTQLISSFQNHPTYHLNIENDKNDTKWNSDCTWINFLRVNSKAKIVKQLIFHFILKIGPAVVKQLLEELEKSVRAIEQKYKTKAKAKNVSTIFCDCLRR